MARELIFGIKPTETIVDGYRVARDRFIVTLSDLAGTQLGRITISPSGEQRGALWLQDSLVGQFEFSQGKWYLYPIEDGRIASRALHIDPLDYLIKRYETASDKPNRSSNEAVA